MSTPDILASVDALLAEKDSLECRLDEALHAFADYEEQMNQHWHKADGDERQRLMAERAQVEESLGIVAIVDRLDQIRALLVQLRSV